MTDNIEQFFNACLTEGVRCIYTENIPKDMMASGVNENGCYEWKLIAETV
ncbi:hypothetical protein [Sphingobacterium siyangense]|jgi:hypothetical protein|nr:hypothetical protein [Sphingobacterium siyangense]